jgi:hypothetical protein
MTPPPLHAPAILQHKAICTPNRHHAPALHDAPAFQYTPTFLQVPALLPGCWPACYQAQPNCRQPTCMTRTSGHILFSTSQASPKEVVSERGRPHMLLPGCRPLQNRPPIRQTQHTHAHTLTTCQAPWTSICSPHLHTNTPHTARDQSQHVCLHTHGLINVSTHV